MFFFLRSPNLDKTTAGQAHAVLQLVAAFTNRKPAAVFLRVCLILGRQGGNQLLNRLVQLPAVLIQQTFSASSLSHDDSSFWQSMYLFAHQYTQLSNPCQWTKAHRPRTVPRTANFSSVYTPEWILFFLRLNGVKHHAASRQFGGDGVPFHSKASEVGGVNCIGIVEGVVSVNFSGEDGSFHLA